MEHGSGSEGRRRGGGQHMKCAERQMEELTEDKQTPCSHLVRHLRQAQSFHCARDVAVHLQCCSCRAENYPAGPRCLDSEMESGARFECISSRGYMMSYDYTAANSTLSRSLRLHRAFT